MTEPTDERAAALALPGDDWPTARRRARRLLVAVRECRPCPSCSLGGELYCHFIQPNWIDDGKAECLECACYGNMAERWREDNEEGY